MVTRADGRATDELRPVRITRHYIKHAPGSVLVENGDTKVLCTATVEDRTAPFLKGTGRGWVTAEYGMLPRSTAERSQREATRGRQGGRTLEIQRLIGRALRAVTDMGALGEKTVIIDCDVIQADGGTRTAAITGAFVALVDALYDLKKKGGTKTVPVNEFLAATSVGIVDGVPCLDLCYTEDKAADVDMNVVMTSSGKFVEVQGTAEQSAFTRQQLDDILGLAEHGVQELIRMQKDALSEVALEVGELEAQIAACDP